MSDQWGIKCNLAEPMSAAREGALCWIGQYEGERVRVYMQSRSPRKVRMWVPVKRLKNFRVAWCPDHLQLQARMWATKEEAQKTIEWLTDSARASNGDV